MMGVQEAAPAPHFAWAGQAVEVSQIATALRGAWRAEAARAAGDSAPLVARTSVLNLIVHASSPQEVEQVATAIERLGVHHPSRTVILLAQPEAAESALASWINAQLVTPPGSNRRLWFEQVTIAARGEAARHLPTVVDPVLVSELPNFLWWLREPPFRSPAFASMVDIVDRLIVDSASFLDPARAFDELAEMAVIPYGAAVSDFAWGRLHPWRELIAQFFDPPDQAASLTTVEQVEVTYEPQGPDHFSGFSQGLLALGWACSRLGWHVQSPPEREGPGAFRWRLQADDRVVEAALRPQHEADAVVGLRGVAIEAGGEYPGVFQVHREDASHLVTRVDVGGVARPDRLMRATLPDDTALLLQHLNHFGHDRVFDEALVFASQLSRGVDERSL